MKIYSPQLIDAGDEVKIQTTFECKQGTKILWYSVDKNYAKYLTTEKSDAFVVGLLLLAMQNNEDIYIEGKMSEILYYNLNNYYIKLLSLSLSNLNEIKIFPKELDNGKSYYCKQAVGTGFSGGVDSFSTICQHMLEDTPESYKITHFLFANVGSHGEFEPEKAKNLFNERYDLLKNYPEETGRNFIKLDSNLSEILNMKFTHTHTVRNASSALLMQKLFSKYYYSSGYKIDETKVQLVDKVSNGSIAYSDAIAQKYLCTETFSFISTSLQLDRVERTKLISNYEPTYKYLNTCVKDGTNCSTCFKCCRTIFTLQLLNKFDKYKDIFNLETFNTKKNLFLASVISDKNSIYNREILQLTKDTGYKFPFYLYILAMYLWIFEKFKNSLKYTIYFFLDQNKIRKI